MGNFRVARTKRKWDMSLDDRAGFRQVRWGESQAEGPR